MKHKNGETMQVDLSKLDKFTAEDYEALKKQIDSRPSKKDNKSSFLKSIVSRNRVRYQDSEFNLDLAHVTDKIIAMGLPAQGIHKVYRNDMNDVLKYF
jgi:hypothetical protein